MKKSLYIIGLLILMFCLQGCGDGVKGNTYTWDSKERNDLHIHRWDITLEFKEDNACVWKEADGLGTYYDGTYEETERGYELKFEMLGVGKLYNAVVDGESLLVTPDGKEEPMHFTKEQ